MVDRPVHLQLGQREHGRPATKADQLIAALEDAGRDQHVPTKDQIVRVLGDDGGAICDDPDDALRQGDAVLDAEQRRHRARACGRSSPTSEPSRASWPIIQVYCPDELEDFKSYVSDLKYDDVVDRVSDGDLDGARRRA